MGKLLSFLGGAAKSYANTLDQDRLEKKRIEDEQRQHTQQVSWAKAANAIRIAQEQASKPPDQRASGMPFPAGPGGFQQATEVATPVKFDNEGNVTEAAGWAPGPSVAVPAPVSKFKESKRVSGSDLVTYRVYEDGSEEEVARGPRASAGRGGGSGGSGAKDRFELRNIGGRVMRVNITTGEKGDMGPASSSNPSGGAKKESADAIREKWSSAAATVDAAGGDALRSIAVQYDMGGLPVTDDDVLRAEVLARVNSEFGARLKDARSGGTGESSKGSSANFAEADAQVAAKRPDLTAEQRKQYLASKGIRP